MVLHQLRRECRLSFLVVGSVGSRSCTKVSGSADSHDMGVRLPITPIAGPQGRLHTNADTVRPLALGGPNRPVGPQGYPQYHC